MSKKPEDYDGGLNVSQELMRILNQPGYVSVMMGGQRAREMYRDGTVYINPERLSPFGLLCYIGAVDAVREEIESGKAPPLSSTETPYKWGYAILTLFGAQQVRSPDSDTPSPRTLHHLDTIKHLISKGLPVDVVDIAGWTALSHAAMAPIGKIDIMKVLLEGGANPNHQGRYGDVPLFGAFQRNNWRETDLLLEHGADLDIPEADGYTPRKFFISCGPQVTAVVQRHIQKRQGKEAPRTDKRCDHCHRSDLPLKNCSKCRVSRYCSVECQRASWPTHKRTCQPFSVTNTLILKPYYDKNSRVFQPVDLARKMTGMTTQATPTSHQRGSHVPKDLTKSDEGKNIVIKVQVPMAPVGSAAGPLFVYTKKRDFVCYIRREDGPANYDQLSKVVREKGVGCVKAYFAAELKSKDELVVKVSEVLAEQPF